MTTTTIHVECPGPTCTAPASVAEAWEEASTHGPVRLVRVTCARRHSFTLHDGRPDFPLPISRQPACGSCGHEAHSPAPCGHLAGAALGLGCSCTVVPIPGVYQ